MRANAHWGLGSIVTLGRVVMTIAASVAVVASDGCHRSVPLDDAGCPTADPDPGESCTAPREGQCPPCSKGRYGKLSAYVCEAGGWQTKLISCEPPFPKTPLDADGCPRYAPPPGEACVAPSKPCVSACDRAGAPIAEQRCEAAGWKTYVTGACGGDAGALTDASADATSD